MNQGMNQCETLLNVVDSYYPNIFRPKQKILELFRRIGFQIDDTVLDDLFYKASGGLEYVSINAFRDVFNDYIIRNNLLKDQRK